MPLLMYTLMKYLGAVGIAAGWLGNDPYYMGRDAAIPLLVAGIVLMVNGVQGDLVAALKDRTAE